jgi:hypothetical protein
MIIKSSNGSLIESVDDWYANAPPKKGKIQWKDNRSAKELAKAWYRPSLPEEMHNLLESHPDFHDFAVAEAIPEYQIQIDNYGGEPRNADLLIIGSSVRGTSLITIEAKADEAFGPIIAEYVSEKAGSRSNVPKRINLLLKAMFARDLCDELGLLRYQLLHGAAATLIEANKRGAKQAAFIVHEFLSTGTDPQKVLRNNMDWSYFLSLLGGVESPGCLSGPFMVAGGDFVPKSIPLFVGKASKVLAL